LTAVEMYTGAQYRGQEKNDRGRKYLLRKCVDAIKS